MSPPVWLLSTPLRVWFAIVLAVNFALGFLCCSAAPAATYRVLYTFCSRAFCNDGQMPVAGLVMDAAGNLYGTTVHGGQSDAGVVFELAKNGGRWKYKVLHQFCARNNCTDGATPWGSLIVDIHGNLFGTAGGGGSTSDDGTIFMLSPKDSGKEWKLSILYTFCPRANCPDGEGPMAGLSYSGQASGTLYDGVSPLYGTTEFGGSNGFGVAFELAMKRGRWRETVLHSFCTQGGSVCTDGNTPAAPLLVSGSSLYGTTIAGGNSSGGGLVFALSRDAGTKTWSETVLYDFCALQNCADGDEPYAGLSEDSAGNLYSTTPYGGNRCANGSHCGVVFQLATGGTENVMHDFCSGPGCPDGSGPYGNLISDASGNMYGTTAYEGSGGGGTVFELGKTFSVLYDFCSQANCSDGEVPYAPVIMDRAGNLFGTTTIGGSDQQGGVVFELSP